MDDTLPPFDADRKIDCGLNFGIGYDNQEWCLDLRYYLGLTDTYKSWKGNKNRGFSLSFGYYFNR